MFSITALPVLCEVCIYLKKVFIIKPEFSFFRLITGGLSILNMCCWRWEDSGTTGGDKRSKGSPAQQTKGSWWWLPVLRSLRTISLMKRETPTASLHQDLWEAWFHFCSVLTWIIKYANPLPCWSFMYNSWANQSQTIQHLESHSRWYSTLFALIELKEGTRCGISTGLASGHSCYNSFYQFFTCISMFFFRLVKTFLLKKECI